MPVRNKSLMVIMLSGVALAAVVAYYQSQLQSERADALRQEESRRQSEQTLQQELKRTNAALSALHDAQEKAKEALASERDSAGSLQQQLEAAVGENARLAAQVKQSSEKVSMLGDEAKKLADTAAGLEREKASLMADIARLRQNFEMVQSVRLRLQQSEQSLAELGLKPGKEDLVRMQLEQLIAQLDQINTFLLAVRDRGLPGAAAAVAAASAASRLTVEDELKIRDELKLLRGQVELLAKDNAVLKEKYRLAEETLGRSTRDSSEREEKIFMLERKLIETENNLSALRERYAGMERDTALLREKYVASELEKESLRVKLSQTTSELDDLRAKFLSLLGRISGLFSSADDQAAGRARVGVELIPQKGGR